VRSGRSYVIQRAFEKWEELRHPSFPRPRVQRLVRRHLVFRLEDIFNRSLKKGRVCSLGSDPGSDSCRRDEPHGGDAGHAPQSVCVRECVCEKVCVSVFMSVCEFVSVCA